MNRSVIFETIVGLIVIVGAGLFAAYAYSVSDNSAGGTYSVSAVFGRIDGVQVGTDVKIAGVKIGTVSENSLDVNTYEARVKLRIASNIAVPEDSVAKIVSDGVLGGAHISIEPGASEEALIEGDVITITQGSVDLLGLAVQAFTGQASAKPADTQADSQAGTQAGTDGAATPQLDPLGEL